MLGAGARRGMRGMAVAAVLGVLLTGCAAEPPTREAPPLPDSISPAPAAAWYVQVTDPVGEWAACYDNELIAETAEDLDATPAMILVILVESATRKDAEVVSTCFHETLISGSVAVGSPG